eukprot:INCI2269.1.p2 GENE.INCI2269.1~~INCI2269.1.p2  ORF type:complete len:132 (-),score=26.23 INCI2269.1:151-546(-)
MSSPPRSLWLRQLVNVCLLTLLLCLLLGDAEGKVAGKRRVKAGAVDDSPTIVDKLWTYAKITLGMSPIFGIFLFAYCVRDSNKEEEARRKKTDGGSDVPGGSSSSAPVYIPSGGFGAGGGGGGSGMGAAAY